jgi:hypothetical protein
MNQGVAKISEEFITETGLKRWIGLELPFDTNLKHPQDALDEVYAQVIEWQSKHQYGNLSNNSSSSIPYPQPNGNPNHVPVIDKAQERLEILIDNATSMDELLQYKNDLTTPHLAHAFTKKLAQLPNF